MTSRTASCRCGQLTATVTSEPVRVSACHCLNCKKRSGSAFAVQARWHQDDVEIAGRSKPFVMIADSGNRATYHFCPECGSDVFYTIDGKFDDKFNELIAIPLGAFPDPFSFRLGFSVWEERKNDWVEIVGEGVEHSF